MVLRAAGPFEGTLGTTKVTGALDMSGDTTGTFKIGDFVFQVTGTNGAAADKDPATFTGTGATGMVAALGHSGTKVTIQFTAPNKNTVQGTINDGGKETKFVLKREIRYTHLTPADKAEHESPPPPALQKILDAMPPFKPEWLKDAKGQPTFWSDFGPVLVRGRTDQTARVMCIASDPGPTECLPFVRHPLVGDAGQRAQGFLRKIGFTKSYVLANAYPIALRPSASSSGKGEAVLNDPDMIKWRTKFYTQLAGDKLQLIVLFGGNAEEAMTLWAKDVGQTFVLSPVMGDVPDPKNPGKTKQGLVYKQSSFTLGGRTIPVISIPHPSSDAHATSAPSSLIIGWRHAVADLRAMIQKGELTPDDPSLLKEDPTPYASDFFTEGDYQPIPRGDLPADAPDWVGDDSWGRAATPQHNNCGKRPPGKTDPQGFNDSIVVVEPDGTKTKYTVSGFDASKPLGPNNQPKWTKAPASGADDGGDDTGGGN
jgi:hypothetical protein